MSDDRPRAPLGLFQGYGIEVELAIVGGRDVAILPVGDRVLFAASGRFAGEVERGATRWSNELVLHVLELKTNGPRPSLDGLASAFARDVAEIERLLEPFGGRLLPTGMHPFMDPLREARLWPHEYGEVYRVYDRAFGTRSHGFSNLQSVQINLPFSGDAEFGRLHAAVRLVLPILPALAASSPVVEGSTTFALDNRLVQYRRNQRLVPSITGLVIPERVYTRHDYEERILRPIERDVRRLDPGSVLEAEWVNSRGAIARFGRSSIEIRVIDSQECPASDVAVAAAAVAVVRALTEERWMGTAEQRVFHESRLERIYTEAVERGPRAVIGDGEYLRAFGLSVPSLTQRELWAHLVESLDVKVDGGRKPLDVILRHGTLSERILRALGGDLRRERLVEVYSELAESLRRSEPFVP